MANFLRRLVSSSRSKSRSKSPQKGSTSSGASFSLPIPPMTVTAARAEEEDFYSTSGTLLMAGTGNHVPATTMMMGGGMDGKTSTATTSGNRQQSGLAGGMPKSVQKQKPAHLHLLPHHHLNHQHHHPQSNHVPHLGRPPSPCSPSSGRCSPPGRPPSYSYAPQSPMSSRRLFSAADEPGTSSQELLSPAIWPSSPAPTPWTMRNSHSNPDSGTSGSQRPSTQQTGATMFGRDEALSPTQTLLSHQRPRSSSPRKSGFVSGQSPDSGSRSRSPTKKSGSRGPSSGTGAAKTLDYLQAQCRLEGCSATILVENTRFLVCKHQLSHASDFFRTLFLNSRALPLEGVRHVGQDEYVIQVSSLRHPPQAMQFQWFLETTVPSPMLRDISDDLLETCMRLCKRFAARGLEMRCTKFIQATVEEKPPLMALCWLNWTFKHRFHRTVQEACLPVVARLSLRQLEKHRQLLPENVFADLLVMKLRTAYQQASTVFHTIHRMDHFHVDMDQCPRCGRQREQGRVRVQASPCHKLVGCERCMREFQCELGGEEQAQQMQAFWQCEHGLWPFSDQTDDCRCQTPLYKMNRLAGPAPDNSSEIGAGSALGAHRRTATPTAASAAGGKCASILTLASKQPSAGGGSSNRS